MINRTTIQVSEKLRKELRALAAKRDVSYQELLSDTISLLKELDNDMTIISVPARLAKKIEEKIKGTDIRTTSEYVTFILRMIFSAPEQHKTEDIDSIRQRLKSLGYL